MDVSLSYFLNGMASNPALLITVLLTLGVIFVNGWTDAPNAIATCITTRCLSARDSYYSQCDFQLPWRTRDDKHQQLPWPSTISNMVDFGRKYGRSADCSVRRSLFYCRLQRRSVLFRYSNQ